MQIKRIRRLPQNESADLCDYCDQPTEKGFQFSGEGVQGPMGIFLIVCDGCLAKTKTSKIGYFKESKK